MASNLKYEHQIEKKDILNTAPGDNAVNATIKSIHRYIPTIIPSSGTEKSFNEVITKNFTLSQESWITDRKPIDTAREYQVDISSTTNIKSPLYSKVAH